jgi:hypothetical protein
MVSGEPWTYVERVIGSIRRQCLDYIGIFNERHLRRVLSSYADHYHRSRTHLSLDKDCPDPRRSRQQGAGESSPPRKSMARTTATNVSLPDSSQILAHQSVERLPLSSADDHAIRDCPISIRRRTLSCRVQPGSLFHRKFKMNFSAHLN